MNNIPKINLSPSQSVLRTIKNWLSEEDEKYNGGFYCNWDIIEYSFHRNELVSFELNMEIIGFVVWSQYEFYIEIDIMEIHYSLRNKGLGKLFFEKVSDAFKEKKALAFKLFCRPRDSEYFWRKMGFIKFPIRGYSESDLTFYKPIIEVSETTEKANSLNKLELWDVDPYRSTKKEARWCWDLEMDNEKLIKPIIQPCNINWNVRWTKDGKIIKEDKVKYFSRDNSIEFRPFMYVEKLSE